MKMTNFQPESGDIAIFGKYLVRVHAKKWSTCIYIAITYEILVQNK